MYDTLAHNANYEKLMKLGWCMWIFCCINKYFQEKTLLKFYEKR